MPDLFIAPNQNQSDPIQTGQDTSLHKRIPIDNPEPVIQQPIQKINNTQNQQPKSNTPLFTSFWQNPSGIYFDTQEIDEHIILFLRRHPITNFGWIVTTLIFILIPPALYYIFTFLHKNFIVDTIKFTSAILAFYYLIVATVAFTYFLNWYYNISLITQKRVVNIMLYSIIIKKIAETKISLVQDVNYQQNGAIRSIFNYGDVLIQTAGTVDNFFINAVPHPENVVHIVENLIGEEGQ